jgi:hypothetical protein
MATLDPLRAEVRKQAEAVSESAGRKLQDELRRNSPYDTGLMQSRTMVQTRGLISSAKVATEYASYVAEGTRPHTIRAKRGKVLSFFWPKAGKQMFLPKVNHPGFRGNSWWTDALGKWHGFLEDGFR